ncbi:MAG: xanthine dehydrogenase family protein subunit M [Chloroflexi bacterium]|nr:xanthine dehydrogenase family protein subunit M [Chloroflexota bacterium]
MHPFRYVAAKSVGEVTKVLAQHGDRARCLAGGTDLLAQARAGRFDLDVVVDVKTVPEANVLELNGQLRIGAAVPCYRVYENSRIAKAYPGIIDGVSIIGGIQIQSRAGMGGNLCNASPSADTIPGMIVHSGQAVIAGLKGTRTIPVEQFCVAPGRTSMQKGEFLLEIRFPKTPQSFGAAYERFTPRNEMDIAIAGVASSLSLDPRSNKIKTARIALAAVGPTPILATKAAEFLAGQQATASNFAAAAALAREEAKPITDMRGTVEQRKHLVGVLTRRTLEKALERAKEAR